MKKWSHDDAQAIAVMVDGAILPVGVLLMSLKKPGRRLSHSFGLRSLIPYTNQC